MTKTKITVDPETFNAIQEACLPLPWMDEATAIEGYQNVVLWTGSDQSPSIIIVRGES